MTRVAPHLFAFSGHLPAASYSRALFSLLGLTGDRRAR
jgi:hypothetical protein